MRAGDLVKYDDVTCRVLKRRRVTGMAMFSTSEFEVKLVSLDGDNVGWVAENEVTKSNDEAAGV